MANQDVQVSEVDVIRAYNQKFGDFQVSLSEHLHQLLHTVEEKQERLQQIMQEMKRERERIDEEISRARERANDAYNCGSYETVYRSDGSSYTRFRPDYDYIRECRKELEHLEGPIYHQAQVCADYGWSKLVQANQIIHEINDRTNKLNNSFQTYVGQGRIFLDKVALYIDQYKSSNLNV